MSPRPRIAFLREKVIKLHQALFFDLSAGVLQFPTSVVNALHVDYYGDIWFMIRRPAQHLHEFDRSFPSRLDFYRKGCPFYLHSTGQTQIVDDHAEIAKLEIAIPGLQEQLDGNMVLACFHIDQVFYYETAPDSPVYRRELIGPGLQPSAFIKALQNIFKDVVPVFQSH